MCQRIVVICFEGAAFGINSDGFFELEKLPQYVYSICRLQHVKNFTEMFVLISVIQCILNGRFAKTHQGTELKVLMSARDNHPWTIFSSTK